MQQAQHRVEHTAEHHRGALGACVGLGELHLGQLQVPVAQLVPREVVERLARLTEFVGVEGGVDLGAHRVEPVDDPAVGVGEGLARGHLAGARAVHQRELGGVEQLGYEAARGQRVRVADGQIAAGLGAAGQGEAQRVGAVGVDPVERVDAVAARLRHLLAVLVADQAVQEHVFERHLLLAALTGGPTRRPTTAPHGIAPRCCDRGIVADVHAEHHHPGHPEEQDVVTGDEHAGGIELRQLGGRVGPAHRGERPQTRGEPGVEHVGVLHPALRRFLAGAEAHDLAFGAVPDRDAVTPPQLPRDAPVVHVVDPVEPARFLAGRVDLHIAFAHGVAERPWPGCRP